MDHGFPMVLATSEIHNLLSGYAKEPVVGVLGSHSALDVADGAIEEGFRTVVLAQQGKENTYARYYRCHRDATGVPWRGCVDETWVLPAFREAATPPVQERLRKKSVVFVPNRALSTYLPLDVLEEDFRVPLVGSRALLRIEERGERTNYYTLLDQCGVPTPQKVDSPDGIDGLVLVKLPHAVRRKDRGFFTASSPTEFQHKSDLLIRAGDITPEDLRQARMERYVIGPVFNFNFFYSPLAESSDALELLGVDERRESSLDGLVRLPAAQQLELPERDRVPDYTVVGHGTLTVRESILEEVFRMGERFVGAVRTRFPPGMIGPFTLQTCIDPAGKPVVFDVAARIGGGTNIHLSVGHPYGNALWRRPVSSGRRLAMEIRRAVKEQRLPEIIT